MISKLRFRHVFGEPHKTKYENVKPTSATCESNLIKGNSLYTAFSWFSSGGGKLCVLPNGGQRKLDGGAPPMIIGHSGPVLDFDFYPFDESFVATGSEDTTIKLWQIPQEGIKEDLVTPLVSLEGHGKKVFFLLLSMFLSVFCYFR